jgi:L-malate glycosyltransferase
MTMTVLHTLVPEPPGEVGGADMHVLDLTRCQLHAGLRPVLIERGSPEFAERVRSSGVEVVSTSGLSFRASVRVLAEQASRLNADVIHAHGYDADYWAATARITHARSFYNRPMVFTQHGIVADTLWHKGKTALDALCAHVADGIIVCAENFLPRMRRWCPRRPVQYIPNGVEALQVPPHEAARAALSTAYGIPTVGPLVGYVGRLSAEKRPDRVLTAVAAARAAGTTVHAAIVGSGRLRPALEEQARRLDIADAVTFTGLVHEVGTVYGALDVLLLLSDTETTSRVVIEAMAAGVLVVASAVGGIPELLDQGRAGLLVPRGDNAAATRALVSALKDNEDLRNAARRRARERYGATSMATRVVEFYQRLRTPTDPSAAGPPVGPSRL